MMNNSILEVVHQSAKELNEVGLIKEVTLREFGAWCLPSIKEYTAKRIRTKSKVVLKKP